MTNPFSVQDKVVLITGAFGLIGAAITEAFLQQGAKVIACDIQQEKVDAMRTKWSGYTEGSHYHICLTDITNASDCDAAVKAGVAAFGKIDVLINNAAIDAKFDAQANDTLNATRFEQFPIDQLQKSIDVNITGLVQITQAVIKQMLQQGFGNIIHVASTYSLVAPNQNLYNLGTGSIQYKPVDYVITKSMIPNFTRYLATFYAADKIRCNAIAPHGIFNHHAEAFVANFAQLSPMGRMSEKEEIIGPFLFLASDASSYMTGTIVTVDGGWTAW